MKKASEDIRTIAVRNVMAGKYSITQVAEMTGYSIATLYNWVIYIKKKNVSRQNRMDTENPSFHKANTSRAGKNNDTRKTRHHSGGNQRTSQ